MNGQDKAGYWEGKKLQHSQNYKLGK